MNNATLHVGFGHPPTHLPSQSIVDVNLAVTVVFTTVCPVFNGLLILVVLFSKQLRSQPYQCLFANYLLSMMTFVFGVGVYRIFQIQNYRYNGLMKSSEETDCGIVRFLDFPLLTSNFCLLLLGCERYLFLMYNRAVSWPVLILFLMLPWTLGIYRYAFELFTPEGQYRNIPYVGLCIDVSSENDSRRILYTILNVTVPLILALIFVIVAYYKTFAAYKSTTIHLRRRSYGNINEESFLLQRKRFIRKVVFRSINLTATLLAVRAIITAVTAYLFSRFSDDGISQDYKDRVGTVGLVIIYLETVIIPIIYLICNKMIQKALINIFFKLNRRVIVRTETINQEEL